MREREINISQKENKLDQREKEIEQHFVQRKLEFNRDVTQRKAKQRKLEGELYVQKADLEKKQNHLDCLINRQPHLNELLSQAEEENKKKDKQIKELKNENCSLRSENFDLKRQISALKEQIKKIKTEVHEKIKRAYQSLTSVVKAVRTLKYDKTGDYKIKELSQKQEYLIDGVADYSAKLAKEEDFPELAKDIENYYGIDKGIQNFVEPPAKKRSRDYDRER